MSRHDVHHLLRAFEIHPSHDMRQFSDIPWGCWSCGACDCHHQAKLLLPCDKGLKPKRKNGTDESD
jgi:hypothetical protein